MIPYCIADLMRLRDVLEPLSDSLYTYRSVLLSEASIGQHTRHILEFYGCLLQAKEVVNYDKRPRAMELETSTQAAVQYIGQLVTNLQQIDERMAKTQHPIRLKANFSAESGKEVDLKSSFVRELAYCLEHSIHHQALIKVGFLEQNLAAQIPNDFGIAPATVRYRESLCSSVNQCNK